MNSQGVFNVISASGSKLWPAQPAAVYNPVTIAASTGTPPGSTDSGKKEKSTIPLFGECTIWYVGIKDLGGNLIYKALLESWNYNFDDCKLAYDRSPKHTDTGFMKFNFQYAGTYYSN